MGHAVKLALLALAVLLGCSGRADDGARAETPTPLETELESTTPVRVAVVVRGTIELSVSGTGWTQALREVHIRAPFTGRLESLDVADGDAVAKGGLIGSIVAQSSDAEREGARAMLAAARTAQERLDAERALELAGAGLVRQRLRAPAAGVVLSHAANAGDFLSEGAEIATVADSSSVAFVVRIPQSELRGVGRGQPAAVEITAEPTALAGVVRGVQPSASAESMNAPVRIDFAPARPDLGVGLFGTARIKVGEHRDVLIVPASAVLRDDVTGVSRVAVITPEGTAHWISVTTPAAQGDSLEVQAAELQAGARVAVSGQVGLPEGARVRVES